MQKLTLIELDSHLSKEEINREIDHLKEKNFENLHITLPYTILKEVSEKYKDSKIVFGVNYLNRVDKGAYTEKVACKILHDQGGFFSFIASSKEKAVYGQHEGEIVSKLDALSHNSLHAVYFIQDGEKEALKKQLSLLLPLKETGALYHTLSMIVLEVPFNHFSSYIPTHEELNALYQKIQETLFEMFGENSKEIKLIIELPEYLLSETQILGNSPFQGSFFKKLSLNH